jgi:hypothetical protein
MRFREKLLILFAAVILSGLGFYLISSPFADLHTLARESGIKTDECRLAAYDSDAFRNRTGVHDTQKIASLDSCRDFLISLCASEVSK